MGKLEDEAKALAEYAKSGGPPHYTLPPENRPVPRGATVTPPRGATITPFHKPEPTLKDEILQMLDELSADIRSGKVEPSHLIMGWGERTEINGEPATTFIWDSTGLNRFEVSGHLQTYALKLALGDDLT